MFGARGRRSCRSAGRCPKPAGPIYIYIERERERVIIIIIQNTIIMNIIQMLLTIVPQAYHYYDYIYIYIYVYVKTYVIQKS